MNSEFYRQLNDRRDFCIKTLKTNAHQIASSFSTEDRSIVDAAIKKLVENDDLTSAKQILADSRNEELLLSYFDLYIFLVADKAIIEGWYSLPHLEHTVGILKQGSCGSAIASMRSGFDLYVVESAFLYLSLGELGNAVMAAEFASTPEMKAQLRDQMDKPIFQLFSGQMKNGNAQTALLTLMHVSKDDLILNALDEFQLKKDAFKDRSNSEEKGVPSIRILSVPIPEPSDPSRINLLVASAHPDYRGFLMDLPPSFLSALDRDFMVFREKGRELPPESIEALGKNCDPPYEREWVGAYASLINEALSSAYKGIAETQEISASKKMTFAWTL